MSTKGIDRQIGDRAKACIGQGYLTNSKNPATDVQGVFPTHFREGKGAVMYDTLGGKWVDWVCALGANHFGYGNEKIDRETMIKGSLMGSCLSGSLEQEVITAEKLKGAFPFIDKIKFVNDGTESCMGAVRAARAYHHAKYDYPRLMVLSEGYHGWSDEFTGMNDNAVGTPFPIYMDKFDINQCFEDREIKSYRYEPDKIAAIIIEPVMLEDNRARIDRLKWLKEYCNLHDIVLIFDEVVTGVRYDSMSVAKCFSIHPDITCFGKAFGNGAKVAFFAGRSDIMDSDYFVSGTYFSHYHSLKAIEVCLDLAQNDATYNSKNLNNHAKYLIERLNELCNPILTFKGWGSRFQLDGDWNAIAQYRQEMAKAKHFTKTTFFYNVPLREFSNEFLDVSKYVITRIRKGDVTLAGPLPIKPLAQRVRDGQGKVEKTDSTKKGT